MSTFQKQLQEHFRYENGGLYWKISLRKGMIDKRAGSGKEQRAIRFNGKKYYENRLIWCFHNGDIPEGYEIGHKNQDVKDNRIENLRLAKKQGEILVDLKSLMSQLEIKNKKIASLENETIELKNLMGIYTRNTLKVGGPKHYDRKAKEIILSFVPHAKLSIGGPNPNYARLVHARKCALITVKYIIATCPAHKDFWEKVQERISKLCKRK